MKKLFITAIFFSIALSAFAQSPSAGRNYVMETVVKVPGKKIKADLAGLPVDSVNRTIQYFDGLGRPLQTVQWQASPLKKDLVSYMVYDGMGREAVKLLPYADQTDTSGSFKTGPLADQAAFYSSSGWDANIPRTDLPFSKTVFESSPLSRPIDQGSPGAVWQPYNAAISGSGHTIRPEYKFNVADEVPLWVVNPTGGATTSATYPANTLYKSIVKDENWTSGKGGTVAEFKDKDGRVVLKRQWRSDTDSLSTYYIYDPYGNLAYVVPPKAATTTTFTESNGSFKSYMYGYHYDGRKRLVQKKVPGKGWEYMVYNKLDQLVLSQDAVQLAAHKWLFNKYDKLGRIILTGIISSTSSRGTWQSTLDADTVLWETRDNANASSTGTGYTNHAKPAHSQVDDYYTINYYDDYDFYGYSSTYDPTLTVSSRTTGLPTATKVNTLGSSTMLLSVMYYDEKGRNIENIADNHLSGTDRILNTYDFTGQLMASTRIHTVSSTTTTIANSFTYDHEGRKVSTKENINSQGEVVLNKLVYNEAGQLKQKYLHSTNGGSTFLQDTKFAYNERGWLKESNSAEFKMKLGYDTLSNPQYNGNIATQLWGTSYGNKFLYTYDKINRLTNGTSTGITMSEVLSYDNMGNIASLNRDGAGAAVYHYNGNQLDSISGGGLTTAHYAYDVNGNATTDGRNRVTLTYNVLNLPTTATKSGLSLAYTYDATGQKLEKVSNTGGTTDYVNGIQYQDGVIDFIQTEEGRALNNGGTYTYQYNLTDHLGNVRYSFDIYSGAVRKLQEDNYYPFGKRKVVTGGTNQYLYNGKELQDELNQYDYGVRFYDPEIGRWNVIDPMSEVSRRWSPYSYGINNPIRFIDADGMLVGDFYDQNGNYIGTDGINDNRIYAITDNKEARSVRQTNDSGGITSTDNLNSAVELPGLGALGESLNVLDRTRKNGGLKEESSLVMNSGDVIQGKTGPMPVIANGMQIAPVNLPPLPTGATISDVKTSVHSHPTEVQISGGLVYSQSATTPSDTDVDTFKQYGTNVIVGRLGQSTVTSDGKGGYNKSYKPLGAVFYNNQGKPSTQLTQRAIKNIVGNQFQKIINRVLNKAH